MTIQRVFLVLLALAGLVVLVCILATFRNAATPAVAPIHRAALQAQAVHEQTVAMTGWASTFANHR